MKYHEMRLNLSGGQVVAGSNPAVPTIENKGLLVFLSGAFFVFASLVWLQFLTTGLLLSKDRCGLADTLWMNQPGSKDDRQFSK
jgi:hypothetical protein